MQTPTVAVRIGPCACPGEPHPDGEVVNLRERLTLSQGIQLQSAILEASKSRLGGPAATGVLSEQYLLVGVESWNLVGMDGPIPVTPETIAEHLLSDFERGNVASNQADELYAERYILPLVQRATNSSPSTTTDESTSPTSDGGTTEPPTPSEPSWTSHTPTDVIELTSV